MRTGAAIAAAALIFGLTSVPANAASQVQLKLATVASIQSANTDVSFVDASGATFWLTVKTTWTRSTANQATLHSIVITPKSFPRGNCVGLELNMFTMNFYSSTRALCPGGTLAYTVNKTYTKASNYHFGQLSMTTQDPYSPSGGGAKTMTIQYNG